MLLVLSINAEAAVAQFRRGWKPEFLIPENLIWLQRLKKLFFLAFWTSLFQSEAEQNHDVKHNKAD